MCSPRGFCITYLGRDRVTHQRATRFVILSKHHLSSQAHPPLLSGQSPSRCKAYSSTCGPAELMTKLTFGCYVAIYRTVGEGPLRVVICLDRHHSCRQQGPQRPFDGATIKDRINLTHILAYPLILWGCHPRSSREPDSSHKECIQCAI